MPKVVVHSYENVTVASETELQQAMEAGGRIAIQDFKNNEQYLEFLNDCPKFLSVTPSTYYDGGVARPEAALFISSPTKNRRNVLGQRRLKAVIEILKERGILSEY